MRIDIVKRYLFINNVSPRKEKCFYDTEWGKLALKTCPFNASCVEERLAPQRLPCAPTCVGLRGDAHQHT